MGFLRKVLLFACWAILPAFCRFLICFLNCSVFKEYFRNAMGVPNSLDQEQARQIFGPDLGLNCLQRLTTDGTNKVKIKYVNTAL